jgi:hypothetical protein
MKVQKIQLLRLLALPLGLLALALPARAQLSLSGNIESDITMVTNSGGSTNVTKYAVTPPGYISTGSISHAGSGVFTSGFTLQEKKGTGSATLLYKPSAGTANPTNAFGGIQTLETLGLGSLKLTDTKLPSNGSVTFMWNVEFASLQVFNGTTAVTNLFTNVPILNVPLTLSLAHIGNTASLALSMPYNSATMFNSLITLNHGYQVSLSPATTLTTLLNSLSVAGGFTATPTSAKTFGTIDVVPTIISPVPEASTYACWASALLVGVVAFRRNRRSSTSPVAI